MKYKIGRYWYKEISEEEHYKIFNDKEQRQILCFLIDYDGEPIKYFKRVKEKN